MAQGALRRSGEERVRGSDQKHGVEPDPRRQHARQPRGASDVGPASDAHDSLRSEKPSNAVEPRKNTPETLNSTRKARHPPNIPPSKTNRRCCAKNPFTGEMEFAANMRPLQNYRGSPVHGGNVRRTKGAIARIVNARTLILVRHCQAAGQEPDAGLTDTGIEQSRNLAAFLRPLQNYRGSPVHAGNVRRTKGAVAG